MIVGIQLLTQSPIDSDHNAAYLSILNQARLAEKLGFSTIWIAHHNVPSDCAYFDPIVLAAGILTVTKKVRVGIREIRVPILNPVSLAQYIASLDVVGNGRIILDICTEYRKESSEAFGVPFNENLPRLKESIEVMKKLWSTPSVTYKGVFYTLSNVSINPKPIQKPWPPIWVTASNINDPKWPIKIADVPEIGDGMRPVLGSTIPELKKDFTAYKTALKKAGKRFEEATFDLIRDTYVAKDSETAKLEYKQYILKKYQTYLKWGVSADALSIKENELSYDMLQERLIVGSPEECIKRIEAYRKELELTHLCIRIHLAGMPEKLAIKATKLFGEKVLPHII